MWETATDGLKVGMKENRRVYAREENAYGLYSRKGHNMKTVEELKTDLETAERNFRFANLRRQWLERRLVEAPTEQEFDAVLAELSAQEETIKKLGIAVASARSAWATADIAARYGSVQD